MPVDSGAEPPVDHGGGGGGDGPDEGGDGIDEEWWPEFEELLLEWDGKFGQAKSKGPAAPPGPGVPSDPPPSPEVAPVPPHPPPPPPHPVPIEPKRDGRGKPRYEKIWVHDADGVVIGWILDNEHVRRFDIHCSKHTDCRLGRPYTPWNPEDGSMTDLRSGQGRCLAFLVAWLRFGQIYEDTPAGRKAHMDCRFGGGASACIMDGSGRARLEAREYVETQPDPKWQGLRDKERQPRPGEPREPLGRF